MQYISMVLAAEHQPPQSRPFGFGVKEYFVPRHDGVQQYELNENKVIIANMAVCQELGYTILVDGKGDNRLCFTALHGPEN